MWGIFITLRCSLSSLVNFSISNSIFFSQNAGPIGTKLGKNVHWMVIISWFYIVVGESTLFFKKREVCSTCMINHRHAKIGPCEENFTSQLWWEITHLNSSYFSMKICEFGLCYGCMFEKTKRPFLREFHMYLNRNF